MATTRTPFADTSSVVLRNREGGWSLMVEMASLEDAAAILGRMGSNGPVTAHIETLNADGRYIRKGQVEIGAAPSPWRVPETRSEPEIPPEPAAQAGAATPPPTPPDAPPPTVGASFRLMVLGLAQVFFGLFGLVLIGAVIFQAWIFLNDRLGEVQAAVASQSASTSAAYRPPTSSPYSTPGLSQDNGIYIATRVDAMAQLLRYAGACGMTEAREFTTAKFIDPVISRFKLNAADVALINRKLAVVPETTCTLTREERMVLVAGMTRLSAEGIMLDAFGALGDAMQPSRP